LKKRNKKLLLLGSQKGCGFIREGQGLHQEKSLLVLFFRKERLSFSAANDYGGCIHVCSKGRKTLRNDPRSSGPQTATRVSDAQGNLARGKPWPRMEFQQDPLISA
jgi:hypothetical protein